MATNFPTSLDALTNPAASDDTLTVSHSSQHTNANDAIEALEAKVGVTSSAVTSSLDYKVSNASSVNPGHKHTLAAALTDVEITAVADGNGLVYNTASSKWINATSSVADASTTVKGLTKLATAPASASNPIAVGDNDARVPTQAENDALVGTSGSPSNSNKYVTNDDIAENTASKVVRRKSDSNLTVPASPTTTTDAASKSYVDTSVTASLSLVQTIFAGGILPVTSATPSSGVANSPCVSFADGASGEAYASCRVPYGAASISSIKIFYERASTGNLILRFDSTSRFSPSAVPVAYSRDTSDANTAYAGGASDNTVGVITVPSGAYDSIGTLAVGDTLSLRVLRVGADVSDTYNTAWNVIAVQFTFA